MKAALCLVVLHLGVSAPTALAAAPAQLAALLERHCIECHDAEVKKGGLDLTALPWQPDAPENERRWIQIHDKVRHGDMPPSKRKTQPTPAERAALLQALHGPLHAASAARQAREGRVVLRRLNRIEYEHTLHDLLGIDTPLRELLPEDGTAHTPDKLGVALNLSAVHLERYLQAADTALLAATASGPRPATTTLRTDYEETWKGWQSAFQRITWTRSPEGRLAIRSLGGLPPHGGLQAWSPPVPGARYRFTIRARALIDRDSLQSRGAHKDAPERRVMLKVGTTTKFHTGLVDPLDYFEMSPREFREFTVEARIPASRTIFLSPYRAVPETPEEIAMNASYAAEIEWIEITGPLHDEWPPRGHTLLYGEKADEDPRKLIAAFLPKAFRRPVGEDEVEEHHAFFQQQRAKGRSREEALRAAYKLALTSPRFLFLQEKPGPLDQHALAARLSYGLWSSTPDDELTRLAAEAKLREPAVLRAQTERLLASPKARRFTQHFLDNWLNLRDIDFTQPDTKLYPEFEHYLQQSMVAETRAFFEELLTHNLSATHLVHSDFAMLNERLAEHYGIPGVSGPQIRKVALPPGSPRGGFITQGAVLKVSANGTTTSPVIRGAYLLERILGTPPDPPPPDVPAVEPDIRGATTIRQQLDLHRNQAACAGCHARLDPPGFALENFDVTGRWRTHYRIVPAAAADKIVSIPGSDRRFYAQGPPVDASYTLADGRPFADIRQYKDILLADPAQLAHAIAEKLALHLTGGTPQFADREVIDRIVARTRPSRHGLRDLLHEIIQSPLFLNK